MSEDSAAKHRAKQTVINLALSLIATLGIVLVTVLIVPRDDSNRIKRIDYIAAAATAEASSKLNLVTPTLPDGWWANQARWSASAADGVKTWKVGFVGPKNQYIGMTQGFGVNPTWIAQQTIGYVPDSTASAENQTWTKYKPGTGTEADPHLWTFELDGVFMTMKSTASEQELDQFADIIESQLREAK